MIFTDTHTHLYSEAYDEDQEAMMQRALDAGVKRFFVPAIDSTYIPAMHGLKQRYPNEVHLMAGLHPTHVKDGYEEELMQVHAMLAQTKCVAIGEIGIDLYWDKSFLTQQQDAFKTQIETALEHDLPFAIHCRDAFNEVFEILEDFKAHSKHLKGVFHCFTGNLQQAQQAIDLNLMLGIGGVATFKNGKIDQFLHELDLKNIVLETDAPYLSPVPYRGKRNESSYLPLIADKLAGIYDTTVEHIAQVTTDNSKRLFGV